MKSELLPPIRVTPQVRQDAEEMLGPNESMTSFLTEAVTTLITRRRLQKAFIERGLASRDDARQHQRYRSAEDVLAELEAIAGEHKDQG